ncbi:MAG: LysR family transcriptional regulator [Pseudomonadota bacterium]
MLSDLDYRCVVALQEERSFLAAAEVLGLSQPAVTARLRRIEERLGVKLFERGRRGAQPTAAGQAFAEEARRIIDLAERSVVAARDAERGLGQHLRVGMTQIAALQVVVPILSAFRNANPYARLRLTEGTTAGLERLLEEQLIDLAFLHPPVHRPGLSERHLLSQPLVKLDARADPGGRPPAVRYTRRDAPVLVAELDRHEPGGVEQEGFAEVDTALGAVVLSQAGYGPFVGIKGFSKTFFASGDCREEESLAMELGTSVVWRSLDRRPLIQALLKACRTVYPD